jgi:UDP-galactose transporter B1
LLSAVTILSESFVVAAQVALFCACGAAGQLFIFHAIRTFGSLTNTLITTTRKFFNILLSVLLNANPLLPQQWAAVAMVFSGLLAHSLLKRKPAPKAKAA